MGLCGDRAFTPFLYPSWLTKLMATLFYVSASKSPRRVLGPEGWRRQRRGPGSLLCWDWEGASPLYC